MFTTTCFIIEDDPITLDWLVRTVKKEFPSLRIVGTATNVSDAIIGIKNTGPSLLLTDIELDPGSSFEVLEQLDNLDFGIIFITSFEQYALQAIKLSAIDYISKPVDLNELKTAISKFTKNQQQQLQIQNMLAHLNRNQQPKKLAIPSEHYVELVEVESILYFKAEINYCRIFLENQKPILVAKTLKEYDSLLSHDPSFIRIHQSHLINRNKVKKIIRSKLPQVVMYNGDILNVARAKKTEFEIQMFGI